MKPSWMSVRRSTLLATRMAGTGPGHPRNSASIESLREPICSTDASDVTSHRMITPCTFAGERLEMAPGTLLSLRAFSSSSLSLSSGVGEDEDEDADAAADDDNDDDDDDDADDAKCPRSMSCTSTRCLPPGVSLFSKQSDFFCVAAGAHPGVGLHLPQAKLEIKDVLPLCLDPSTRMRTLSLASSCSSNGTPDTASDGSRSRGVGA
mmetsp:Transcript_30174/g.59084  ORF Transcript_30174/g.59084 Transcript_30174/m.59084 type:complete len:207 (-) Transcript_30174:71-691(-)